MTKRSVVLLNKDNVVVSLLFFDDLDMLDAGALAGLLSNPEFIEVDYGSEATIGWKYIDGKVVKDG